MAFVFVAENYTTGVVAQLLAAEAHEHFQAFREASGDGTGTTSTKERHRTTTPNASPSTE